VFAPLGIDWRGGVALLSGFVAKEIVVSTLGVLHAVDGDEKSEALRKALRTSGMTPLSALSMMVFVLLYLPCLATVTTIRRETGSYKWMVFSILYSTSIAWLVAFVVYQVGTGWWLLLFIRWARCWDLAKSGFKTPSPRYKERDFASIF
jgi:ferrous iron transport protein B